MMKQCPVCGLHRVRKVATAYVTPGGRKLAGVVRDHCAACGEEFFTVETVKKIRLADNKGKHGKNGRVAA